MNVSVIIPAYNEAKRILSVLNTALKSPLVNEVIVIDDGSKDGTSNLVKKIKNKKLKLFILKKNKGKSNAMKYGLKKAKEEYILFLDADLIGLQKEDLNKIILPVLNKKVNITLCLHKNSPWRFYSLDYLSGLRCLKKSYLGDFSFLDNIPGFGAEVSMNKIILNKNLKIGIVDLPNVLSPIKKEDGNSTIGKFFIITRQAIKTCGGFFSAIKMIFKMKQNSVFLG